MRFDTCPNQTNREMPTNLTENWTHLKFHTMFKCEFQVQNSVREICQMKFWGEFEYLRTIVSVLKSIVFVAVALFCRALDS